MFDRVLQWVVYVSDILEYVWIIYEFISVSEATGKSQGDRQTQPGCSKSLGHSSNSTSVSSLRDEDDSSRSSDGREKVRRRSDSTQPHCSQSITPRQPEPVRPQTDIKSSRTDDPVRIKCREMILIALNTPSNPPHIMPVINCFFRQKTKTSRSFCDEPILFLARKNYFVVIWLVMWQG